MPKLVKVASAFRLSTSIGNKSKGTYVGNILRYPVPAQSFTTDELTGLYNELTNNTCKDKEEQ